MTTICAQCETKFNVELFQFTLSKVASQKRFCVIPVFCHVNFRHAVCQECPQTGAAGGDHRNTVRLARPKPESQSDYCSLWQLSQWLPFTLPVLYWNSLFLFQRQSTPSDDPNYY